MRNLVIVEAAGKVDTLRASLKSIGFSADVIATVGHVADNPRSLNPICLDADLHETAYAFREDRLALLAKIQRAAFNADRIYIATDDDHEGDVIAQDVARYLADYGDRLYRVRLRAITASELKESFGGSLSRDFDTPAWHGICRRIVDRAIGAAFTQVAGAATIPVGRVQSSLLANIQSEPPVIGQYDVPLKLSDGGVYWASIPIKTDTDLERAMELERLAAAAKVHLLDAAEADVAAAHPWGYEDVVAEASVRLRISIEDAAAVFQEAYERGLVSYPRVRAGAFTQDAVEVAASIAAHNGCAFDAARLPLRDAGGEGRRAHECPRPLQDDLLLGRPMSVLDNSEALAVLVARNVIECGQSVKRRRVRARVDGDVLTFECDLARPRRPWKLAERKAGFNHVTRPVALLRYMVGAELGKPSTVVSHASKFLQRGLLEEGGIGFRLNERGNRWLAYATSCGFRADTSARMERAIEQPMSDPHVRVREVLRQHGLLDQIKRASAATPKSAALDESVPEPF
ncbi:MAG: DNA topoisomerase [Burkholderia gladioli]